MRLVIAVVVAVLGLATVFYLEQPKRLVIAVVVAVLGLATVFYLEQPRCSVVLEPECNWPAH